MSHCWPVGPLAHQELVNDFTYVSSLATETGHQSNQQTGQLTWPTSVRLACVCGCRVEMKWKLEWTHTHTHSPRSTNWMTAWQVSFVWLWSRWSRWSRRSWRFGIWILGQCPRATRCHVSGELGNQRIRQPIKRRVTCNWSVHVTPMSTESHHLNPKSHPVQPQWCGGGGLRAHPDLLLQCIRNWEMYSGKPF